MFTLDLGIKAFHGFSMLFSLSKTRQQVQNAKHVATCQSTAAQFPSADGFELQTGFSKRFPVTNPLPEQACKICKICKDNSKEKKNWCNRLESSLSPKSWICSTHINWVECSSRSNMSDISSELTSNYWWLPKQKTIQSQGYRRFVVESATAQRPIMSLICKCYPDISRPPRQIGGMLFWSQCSRTQSSGNLAKLDKYNLLPSLKFVRLPSDCACHNACLLDFWPVVSEKLSAFKGTSALRSAPSAICQNILALSFYCCLLGRDENQAKGSLHLASNSKQYQDLEESMKSYPSEKKGRRQAASISFSKNHCTVSIDLICMYCIVFPHQTQVHVPSVSRFWKPFWAQDRYQWLVLGQDTCYPDHRLRYCSVDICWPKTRRRLLARHGQQIQQLGGNFFWFCFAPTRWESKRFQKGPWSTSSWTWNGQEEQRNTLYDVVRIYVERREKIWNIL